MCALNINALWTWFIVPVRDHSECINASADAGICIFAGLHGGSVWLDPNNSTWEQTQLDRFAGVIDPMSLYSNIEESNGDTNSTEKKDSKLSVAAIARIVVGVLVLLIAILGAALFFLYRRKQAMKAMETVSPASETKAAGMA
ncbi:hypothetical protein CC80DRAFT_549479 [Byssothecium circinans]|uniref:1,3-beta-glucanosyltransferase n=1 Tax=Byssothecium circinans TaxID=147558 RepID=A0A6A5TRG9_9PLEO|nr:hypothetical protein CC80DRAFT_549479 [Byssothecium circinans]